VVTLEVHYKIETEYTYVSSTIRINDSFQHSGLFRRGSRGALPVWHITAGRECSGGFCDSKVGRGVKQMLASEGTRHKSHQFSSHSPQFSYLQKAGSSRIRRIWEIFTIIQHRIWKDFGNAVMDAGWNFFITATTVRGAPGVLRFALSALDWSKSAVNFLPPTSSDLLYSYNMLGLNHSLLLRHKIVECNYPGAVTCQSQHQYLWLVLRWGESAPWQCREGVCSSSMLFWLRLCVLLCYHCGANNAFNILFKTPGQGSGWHPLWTGISVDINKMACCTQGHSWVAMYANSFHIRLAS
jgi:hypothetical protein